MLYNYGKICYNIGMFIGSGTRRVLHLKIKRQWYGCYFLVD